MKLLVVDDDPKLRDYVSRGLEDCGIGCETAADTAAARELIRANGSGFDLILLDVMLPDRPGWDLLRELREESITTPVIFLTARHSVEERVKGLQLGADDYIIKPFDFGELLARIEAVARRAGPVSIAVGDLEIDPAERTVRRAGKDIAVSPKEFELLRCLAEADGEVRSKRDLLREVWGIDFDPGTNVVEVSIARLRRKVEARGPRLIHTLVGRGYRLAAAEEGA
jgi:two-component system OmpR family response regulator